MRCPSCGATNGPSATFCGQCHLRFTPPQTDQPAADRPAVPGSVSRGRFVAEGDRIGWTCAVCDELNDLDTFACEVCGTRMDAEAGAGADIDWDAAKRWESLVPGTGHLRAGLPGQGLARLVIGGFWLIGAVLLSTGGLRGLITAVPLLLGLATMMLLGPGDLDAARAGRPGRLDGRNLALLIGGVLLGVIVIGAVQAVVGR